jgi:hypothetical protein
MKASTGPPLTKRELCRLSVLLCILFLRNLAYYRTGQGQQGRHLLDPSETTVNFWQQLRPSETTRAAGCHFNFAQPMTFQHCADRFL